ncbi:MAG: PIG-L family deacetylase [bacterium]|nr:PIG-L family deacetylase [bacterium]
MDSLYQILLIEPDPTLANSICSWLNLKAEITHIADKYNVQQQIGLNNWDLVIIDYNYLEINNLDMIQVIKNTTPSTATLIIAENIKVDFILLAMKYHADGLMFKPLDESEFIARVLQLAEEARLKRSMGSKIILAIGAHPDDVELGCGGTLAKLRDEGNEINILTLSLGEVGGAPQARKKEAELAAKLQGATLFLGDFDDTQIINSRDTIQFIESIVQQVQPTHVYTHSFNDSHQDHRSVFQASVTACRSISNLFCYLSPSGTIDFRPNVFINIDKYMEKKLKVITSFTSQIDTRPYLNPEVIKITALYWGRFGNCSMVEPLEVIKGNS